MKTFGKTLASILATTTLVSFNAFAVDSPSDSGTNPDTGAKASADAGTAEASSLKPADTEKRSEVKKGAACASDACCCNQDKSDKSEE